VENQESRKPESRRLDILLDGRNKDEMQKAVVEGFKKIGVQW
jgi:hypothetical protein